MKAEQKQIMFFRLVATTINVLLVGISVFNFCPTSPIINFIVIFGNAYFVTYIIIDVFPEIREFNLLSICSNFCFIFVLWFITEPLKFTMTDVLVAKVCVIFTITVSSIVLLIKYLSIDS